MRDISTKVDNVGDTLTADDFNSNQIEMESAVTSSGQTLDPAGGPDTDTEMLSKAMAVYGSGASSFVDSGAANAYVLNPVNPHVDAPFYFDGMEIRFFAVQGNTGASTVNVNSLGIKDIKAPDGSDLIAGDINGVDATVAVFSSTADEFILVEPIQTALNNQGNAIINGDFDVWQRATSQTSAGYGSDDRWENYHTGTTVKTHTRQLFTLGQTDVPGNPFAYSRTVVTNGSAVDEYCMKQQKIDPVRTFAGETVTLSFWAKADASKNIATEFTQQFGTGGSPSSEVNAIGVTTHALTTSWQQFTVTVDIPSISGKTIGTNNNDFLQIRFWFDAGSNFNSRTNSLGHQSGTFDLARVQLKEGRRVTAFERLTSNQVLDLCMRYYEISGLVQERASLFNGDVTSGNQYRARVPFSVDKRAVPVVTLTNEAAAGFPATPGTPTVSTKGFQEIRTSSVTAANARFSSYWTADAEIL